MGKILLRISNENDRAAVAQILYKNGYTVRPVRYKKNGKSFEYCVQAELVNPDIPEPEPAKKNEG